MERKYQVASAVRRALVMGALTAAGATPALAQENLGEIVVTGSRIRSANLESTTPVTQVTAADVVTQGVTRIEDLVNQLPQAFAAQNVTVANGSTGTATLNLRGLGSARTLVLVDGRRMPYGGVTNSAADINQIPTQMVERVDILTGGASAVYGSDAVAGVVNFIMKKDFEGVQVTSQYNFYWHENDYGGPGDVKLRDTIAQLSEANPDQFQLPDDTVTDGEGKELSLMVGVNSGDGRGNITAYATVFDGRPGAAARPRLLGLLAGYRPAGRVVRLRRFRDELGRHVHRLRHLLPDDRHGGRHAGLRRRRPVQLRPAEPLPASGAPLQPRRDGSLRVRRACGRVHAADVHRLRVGRADRPGRQLLRHQLGQLRQPAAADRYPGYHRLRRGRDRGRRRRGDVHRPAQRRGRRTAGCVRELFVPHGGGRARRDQRRVGLRRLRPVLHPDGQRLDAQFLREGPPQPRARRRRRGRRADLPVRVQSTARTRPACPGIRSCRTASPRLSSTTCRSRRCRWAG